MIEYTVRPRDQLADIAERFAVRVETIVALNPGIGPNRLQVGKVLELPDARGPVPERAATRNRETGGEATAALEVVRGQLTFDAEGSDHPGPYFSRIPDQRTSSHAQPAWTGRSGVAALRNISGDLHSSALAIRRHTCRRWRG